MKFTTLVIRNFGSIEEAAINLNDRGLVLVQGERRDATAATSNGAGKSTLMSALTWVLYGQTDKGLSGDAVVRSGSKQACQVTVHIEDGAESYFITRYRKHPTMKNSVRVTRIPGVDLTKGNDKLTQGVIDRIVGCSWEVFSAAVYAGQEKVPDIPSMTDRQLKVLIEEAAGVTQLEAAYEMARNEYAKAEKAEEAANSILQKEDWNKELKETLLASAIKSAETWEEEKRQRIDRFKAQAVTLVAKVRELREKMNEFPSTSDIDKRIAEAEEKDALIKSVLKEARDDFVAAQSVERHYAMAKAKLIMERDNAANLVKTLADLLTKLTHYGPGTCSECGRDHDEQTHKEHIRNINLKYTDAKTTLNDLESRLASVIVTHKAAGSALEAAQKATTYDDSAEKEAASLRLLRLSRVNAERNLRDAIESFKVLKASQEQEEETQNPFVVKVGEIQKDIEAACEAVERAAVVVKERTEYRELAKKVVDVFGPKGVRAQILDTVTPYLNERTAHYLGALADGRIEAVWTTLTLNAKGEPRENFSVMVRNSDGSDGFASLSGGEKRKVRLACALALQDLVATRATKPINLFIADEIDAALDEAGLERLMGILEEKARERGSVFVISHSDLKGWVSSTINVIREHGVSRVEDAANV